MPYRLLAALLLMLCACERRPVVSWDEAMAQYQYQHIAGADKPMPGR